MVIDKQADLLGFPAFLMAMLALWISRLAVVLLASVCQSYGDMQIPWRTGFTPMEVILTSFFSRIPGKGFRGQIPGTEHFPLLALMGLRCVDDRVVVVGVRF